MKNIKPAIDHEHDMIDIAKLDSAGNDIDYLSIEPCYMFPVFDMLILSITETYDSLSSKKVADAIEKLEEKGKIKIGQYFIEVAERRYDLDYQFKSIGFHE